MNGGDSASAAPGSGANRALGSATARLIGWVGIGFAVTGAVIWVVAPIAMPETTSEVARHYSDHRSALILASIAVVGGSALVAAWYVALAALVHTTPRGRLLGSVGVVGMAIQIAAVSVGFTIFAAVAYREPPAETAQLATDIGWLLVNLAAGPVTSVAVVAFGAALSRDGYGSGWLMPFSLVVALAHLVVAASFADEGFFSPVGGIEIVVPLLYQAWIGAIALALVYGRRSVNATAMVSNSSTDHWS
jgi:hypothetical protein